MKKIIFIIFLFLTFNPSFALDEGEIELPSDAIKKNNEFEKPILLEKEDINPYSKEGLKAIIEKDYDTNSSSGMFEKQLSAKFNRGPIHSTIFHLHTIHTMGETIKDSDSDFKFDTNLINVGVRGKFKSEVDGYNFMFDLTPEVFDDFSHRFILDAYVETRRIPNHVLLFGASRPQLGYEGGMSAKTLPFLLRSQTGRNFGNLRKKGLKLRGNFKYIDYEVGGYSSDTYYHEFLPGVETDLWVNFKPLANLNQKYGNLNIGGGVALGERNSKDFVVASSALRYEYKNFWARAEYQNADGSNGGSGITENKAYGYNLTLAYRLTKKLEFLLRYDDFDSNKSIKNNNTKEYTAGLNWYILGQCARVILNYIYCDNDSKEDSHKILLGTQFIL